jgi:hypothetical protein
MEIYPHLGSTYFSDKNNNYTERNSNKTIIIVDGTFESGVFNINEHSLTDIISKDKVYISKHSSFSPLLLSRIEGIDVSRVISAEKAMKIVIDEVEYSEYGSQNLWYGEFVSADEEAPVIRGLFGQAADFKRDFLNRVKDPITREYIPNLQNYTTSGVARPCVISNVDFEISSLILTYPKKIVVTTKLEDYINNFLPELDKDALDSCISMLGSKDMNAVKLGINMLATFNVSQYTIPISLAIRNNIQNLLTIKSLAAFKRVCSLCKISPNDIRNVPLLEFNIQIYRNSNNPEHRSLIKDNIAKSIENEISSSFSRYFDEVGLSFNLSEKI